MITEEEIARYEALNQKAVEFEMRWESAIRSVKSGLVDMAESFGWVLDKIATPPSIPVAPGGQVGSRIEHRVHAAHIKELEDLGAEYLRAQIAKKQRELDQYSPGIGDFAKAALAQALGTIYIPSGPEAQNFGKAAIQLKDLKEALAVLTKTPPHSPLPLDGVGEKGATAAERAFDAAQKLLAELQKRTDEAFVKTRFDERFGENSLAGKFYSDLYKIDRENDERESGPAGGSPQIIWQSENQAFEERMAKVRGLRMKGDAQLKEFETEIADLVANAFLGDGPDNWRRKIAEKLDRGVKESGFDLRQFGSLTIPPPPDISPEQQLKDARNRSTRGLALYSTQAGLAGVNEIDQINTIGAMRVRSADDEYKALMRLAGLKNTQEEKQNARQDASDQREQELFAARLERDQQLLQLALRQKEAFQGFAVEAVDSLINGKGLDFLKSKGMGLADKLISNAAGMAWADISKIIPHASGILGNLLGGTPFGPDPLASATFDNTTATLDNTLALRALATSPTGGGGGLTSFGSDSLARFFTSNPYVPLGEPGIPLGEPASSPWIPAGDAGGPTVEPGLNAPFAEAAMAPWMRDVGVGTAAAAGGFGIYSGIKAGGPQGDLTAAASFSGAAGSIMALLDPALKLAGPIGMIAGMGLGVVSELLGNPKQERAAELQNEATSRAVTIPTGTDYTADIYGRPVNYNYQGGMQPVVVQQTVNVQAIDGPSLETHLTNNPAAVSLGIVKTITSGNGEDMLATLRTYM